jgi:hypothetical protein
MIADRSSLDGIQFTKRRPAKAQMSRRSPALAACTIGLGVVLVLLIMLTRLGVAFSGLTQSLLAPFGIILVAIASGGRAAGFASRQAVLDLTRDGPGLIYALWRAPALRGVAVRGLFRQRDHGSSNDCPPAAARASKCVAPHLEHQPTQDYGLAADARGAAGCRLA